VPTDTLQERVPKEFLSSSIPVDERQLYQERKAKDFLSSPSSSPLLFPTTQNKTYLTSYDPSSLSSIKEQQNFPHNHQYEQQHSDRQSSTIETKNNQSFLSEQSENPQKPKESSIGNNHIHRKDPSEDENSFSLSRLFKDNIEPNSNNGDQLYPLPLASILRPLSSLNPTTNANTFPLSSSKISNHIFHRPLAQRLYSDFQDKSNVWQLNNMSSFRNSSAADTNNTRPTTHSYDQRVCDQGNKYVIQLKTDDYDENEFTIIPKYSQNQLIIDAIHNEEDSLGGYIRRELHKIFPIPKHVDLNKYAYIYNKKTQELTIEMPYLPTIINENKHESSFNSPIRDTTQLLTFSYGDLNLTNAENNLPTTHSRLDHHQVSIGNTDSNKTSRINTAINDSPITANPTVTSSKNDSLIGKSKPFDFDSFHRSAFRPQIIPATLNENKNENKLLMSLDLTDYLPEDIKVSIKDQELIVKAERKIESGTRKSRTSFFQSTSLPPLTDIERLQSNYIDGKLIIEAPYLDRHIKIINNPETNK